MPQDMRDAFFHSLHQCAKEDPSLMFLTADMGAFSFEDFRREFPSRCINMGVAEQNMISVAAGLALSGKKVFVYSIIPFVTSRCYEQLCVDLSVMDLPVVVAGIGAGFTYGGDGPTHHAVSDITLMRTLPNFTVFSPCDDVSTQAACRLAHKSQHPVYMRLEKGVVPSLYTHEQELNDGLKLLKEGKDVLIVATGNMTHQALAAADLLAQKNIQAGVVDVFCLKPFNVDYWSRLEKRARMVVTLEEHYLTGGLGSLIQQALPFKETTTIVPMGINDVHTKTPVAREQLQAEHGLSVDQIVARIVQLHGGR